MNSLMVLHLILHQVFCCSKYLSSLRLFYAYLGEVFSALLISDAPSGVQRIGLCLEKCLEGVLEFFHFGLL